MSIVDVIRNEAAVADRTAYLIRAWLSQGFEPLLQLRIGSNTGWRFRESAERKEKHHAKEGTNGAGPMAPVFAAC